MKTRAEPDASLAPFIPRKPADPEQADPAGFWGLRREAIARAQDASGKTWTDYNLHDPGVTILEQLCYALTDLVVRVDQRVADHLAGPDGAIDFKRLGLLLPQQALPSRAGTAADYRRFLLDRVAELDDAQVTIPSNADRQTKPIAGVHRLAIKVSHAVPPEREREVAQAAARAWGAQRNLGEDLDETVDVVERRRCHLRARLGVAGPRSPAAILAEVYAISEAYVADRLRPATLRTLLHEERSLESIFTGPLTERGFIDEAQARAEPRAVLSLGDLGRLILAVDGVRSVEALALLPVAAPPTLGAEGPVITDAEGAALAWRGVDAGRHWALSLLVPTADSEGFEPRVTLKRGSQQVVLDRSDLRDEYQSLRLSMTSPSAAANDVEALVTRPRGAAAVEGEPTRARHWTSVQDQFPAIYGLGREGLPASATALERARRRQLQAYLTLFDQVMANGAAQIDHLAPLFSVRSGGPTYWWGVVGRDSVPDIEALYLKPPEEVASSVFAAHDDARARGHRALDALLALYGQTYTQSALRLSLTHLDGDELEQRLLANKRDYLAQIETLSRDRAAGFDVAHPHWDAPANTSGLQRSASLLLGFRRCSARSLLTALKQRELALGGESSGPIGAPHPLTPRQLAALQPLPAPSKDGGDDPAAGRWVGAGATAWPAGLVAAGASRARYRLLPLAGGPSFVLMLQASAEPARWWRIAGPFKDPAEAARVADGVRRELLALNDDAEGMHVVEHVLLRPRGPHGAAGEDTPHRRLGIEPSFYDLRVTVVFANWSARAGTAAFRALAEETVRLSCPAHVESRRCLWLGQADMEEFEARWATWLGALQAWSTQPLASRRPEVLDQAACGVIESLKRQGVT